MMMIMMMMTMTVVAPLYFCIQPLRLQLPGQAWEAGKPASLLSGHYHHHHEDEDEHEHDHDHEDDNDVLFLKILTKCKVIACSRKASEHLVNHGCN